jgi:tRNA/tmRNA/rRNA uracil-C5-methylase (TrmA/RlmC/RlmD family)
VASLHIPDVVVPSPHLGFVQVKVHNLSQLAKRLREWVKVHNLVDKFCGQWDWSRIWEDETGTL